MKYVIILYLCSFVNVQPTCYSEKIVSLESAISKGNKPDPKKSNKRKGPDPNVHHIIPIGNSIVLGNPNAKVTVTKFTDFQ